ncbi:hypothetical protein NMG60_11009382 [Bertholletia excelsa]
MGSRDINYQNVLTPENRRPPEVIHFTARMEEPQSARDCESKAESSSGESGDPNDKREESNGSGRVMRILRGVGVVALGVAAVGGALLLGGALSSSGGSGESDDDNQGKKKMMIAPGTDRKLKIPREDFLNDTAGYFRGLRNKNKG